MADVKQGVLPEEVLPMLLERAEQDYSSATTFDFEGLAVPSLNASRWWELAVLCVIVLGNVQPQRLEVMLKTSAPTRRLPRELLSLSDHRVQQWEAIAIRACIIMSSGSFVPNGLPVRYDRIEGRRCACIRPPQVASIDAVPDQLQSVAAEALSLAKLHLETVEKINAIHLPELTGSDTERQAENRDRRADHLHGSHAGESAANFVLTFGLTQPADVPTDELFKALDAIDMAIPRLHECSIYPPVCTYERVLNMAANAARAVGMDAQVFLKIKHHLIVTSSPERSRLEDLRAAIDELRARVQDQSQPRQTQTEVQAPVATVLSQSSLMSEVQRVHESLSSRFDKVASGLERRINKIGGTVTTTRRRKKSKAKRAKPQTIEPQVDTRVQTHQNRATSILPPNQPNPGEDKVEIEMWLTLPPLCREILQAMWDKRSLISTMKKKPSTPLIAKWVGCKLNTTLKSALSALVMAGYLGNEKHDGRQGGYYFKPKGLRAAEYLADRHV